MTGREVLQRLKAAGWTVLAVQGSHLLLSKSEQRCVVLAERNRHLQPETLDEIERITGEKLR